MVGRNVNFRASDTSSAQTNLLEARYRKRLDLPDGDPVVQRIKRERPILPIFTHYNFHESDLLFDAFANRSLTYILTVRHPMALVDYWAKGKWGVRIQRDPRSFQLWCRVGGKVVPAHASEWADEYKRARADLSEAVLTVVRFLRAFEERQKRLSASEKKCVQIVSFEEFVVNPMSFLKVISTRLKTSLTPLTFQMMKKQRLPRFKFKSELAVQEKRLDAVLCSKQLQSSLKEELAYFCKNYMAKYGGMG
jgi:hypothetical protein